MRVISGRYKGKILKCYEGLTTRPTIDRVKESLFNIIQFKIDQNAVLDLFAGSGQLGLECLSRGALYADFCEVDKKAFEILKSNLKDIENCKIFNTDYKNFIKGLKLTEKYDIIFIDPPFSENLYTSAINLIKPFLDNKGIIVCESSSDYSFESFDNLELFDQRKYGRTMLSFFKKEQNLLE